MDEDDEVMGKFPSRLLKFKGRGEGGRETCAGAGVKGGAFTPYRRPSLKGRASAPPGRNADKEAA